MSRTTKTVTQVITRKGKCTTVRIDKISTGASIRLSQEVSDGKLSKKFRALENSIKANGIMVPIIVKKDDENDTYSIVDGYRRFEAAQRLGIKKLQVISYDDIDDKEEMLSIVTNSNQKTLTAIELGMTYKKLIDRGIYSSNRELAVALGVAEGTVGTKINNLKLDSRIIKDLLTGNGINDQKVLKAIRTLEKVDSEGSSDTQWSAYEYIIKNELGRKESLEYIKSQKESDTTEAQPFTKTETDREIKVVIDKEGLTEAIVSEIERLLEEIETLRSAPIVDAAA